MELPPNLQANGASPEFDAHTVPVALLGRHAIGPRNWAVLHVLAGSIVFVDMARNATMRLDRGAAHVIAPTAPHRIEPSADARFRIDFFREPD